jgi:prepilin signal peptidase PulO-like enzyme (type II secretory pathway)
MVVRFLLAVLYLTFSLYLALRDIRHGEVSRVLLWLALLTALAGQVLGRGLAALPAAAGGGALGIGFFLLVFFCSGKKLGLADVWYSGLIGVVLGPLWWFGGIILACLGAIGYCVISRRRTVPFIPFMAAGSAAVMPLAWGSVL